MAAMLLGAGRQRAEDKIDHAVGLNIVTHVGDETAADGAIFTVNYRHEENLVVAVSLLSSAFTVTDNAPSATPIVLESIT